MKASETPLVQSNEDNSPEALLRTALWTPGIMHVLDNCAHDVVKNMPGYKPWESNMTAVRAFFSSSHHREQFTVHCLRDAPGCVQTLFSTYAPATLDWRWGTLLCTVEWLLLREDAIRRSWDMSKLEAASRSKTQQQSHAAEQEDGGDGAANVLAEDVQDQQARMAERRQLESDRKVKMQKADQAVSDPLFWSFAKLVHLLASIAASLTSWAQACPCHSSTIAKIYTSASRFLRQKYFSTITGLLPTTAQQHILMNSTSKVKQSRLQASYMYLQRATHSYCISVWTKH